MQPSDRPATKEGAEGTSLGWRIAAAITTARLGRPRRSSIGTGYSRCPRTDGPSASAGFVAISQTLRPSVFSGAGFPRKACARNRLRAIWNRYLYLFLLTGLEIALAVLFNGIGICTVIVTQKLNRVSNCEGMLFEAFTYTHYHDCQLA